MASAKKSSARKSTSRGVTPDEATRLVTSFDNVVEGTAYGHPAFLINGRFFARFRDDSTVLVVHLSSIDDRDLLMQVDPDAFFFTDHYRNYPAVLIRLEKVRKAILSDVVKQSWHHVSSLPPSRHRRR
jgi:hypothetical protein